MIDFVTLSCPSCGGKLEVTRDIECFACAHCGREHVVKRTGGTVSLSPVVDALRKVEVGVDKTAAELAIARIQKEIEDIQVQKQTLLANSPRPEINATPAFFLILIGAVGIFIGLTYHPTVAPDYIFIVGGIIFGLLGLLSFSSQSSGPKRWDTTIGVQLESLDKQLAAKKAELLRHRNVVSM